MSFPNPQDHFISSSQPQQPYSHLSYCAPQHPPPPDVNAQHMQRPPPAGPRMHQVSRFSHPPLHHPPPSHMHPIHPSAPIPPYPQPGAPSQPPHYVYSAAVPVADSSRPHAQPTTTSRSVQASHVAISVPSYAPPSHAPYASKIAPHMHSHIPCPQPHMMAPPPLPPPEPPTQLHSHVVQSRPLATPSPVRAKPVLDPHHRLPPHQGVQQSRPLQPTQPAGVRPFVGPLSKDQFVENSARDLDYTAFRNDDTFPLPLYSEPESVFFSVVKPEIPTKEYMKRLVMYTHCSPSAFILMLVYLDRVARNNKKLVVTPYNMHRLLITALTLACKNLDDQCFANAHYAKVGGIPTVREMNRLELQFLKYMKYHLFVNREEHDLKIEQLGALEPNSPTSIHGQSFSPPPDPTKMGFDRKPNNGTRAYGRVVPMRTKPDSETTGNHYAFHQNLKGLNGAASQQVNCAPEIYEKIMRSRGAMMSSVYPGVQRRLPSSSAKRCRNVMDSTEVCRTSAPMEASYVTSASARGGCRP